MSAMLPFGNKRKSFEKFKTLNGIMITSPSGRPKDSKKNERRGSGECQKKKSKSKEISLRRDETWISARVRRMRWRGGLRRNLVGGNGGLFMQCLVPLAMALVCLSGVGRGMQVG